MQLPKVSSDWQVLYICSAARCGSTFTDMFVGGHSQAASLGEINFLGKELTLNQACSCGESLKSCDSWNAVYREIHACTGIDVRTDPYTFRLWDALAWNTVDPNRQTASYKLAVYWRKLWLELRHKSICWLPLLRSQRQSLKNKIVLYDAVAELWGKRLIVDSSKNAREAIELNRLLPGRVKVLLVTRDGRGVFASRRKNKVNRYESISGWMNYYRKVPSLLAKQLLSLDFFTVRYEDLAAFPDAAGKRLCGFVGLDFESSMLDLGAVVRHMVNGNDTRFSAQRGIRLDESWKSVLSTEDLKYFSDAGGAELNQRLGYISDD